VRSLPAFKVIKRAEQPPVGEYHILLVHRFSADKTSLVHDITGRVPALRDAEFMAGPDAFTGTPGEALRRAELLAVEHGAPMVYVRDDTGS
jgi:hypothetical protein